MREAAAVAAAQLTLGAALRQATADLRRAGIEGAGDDARRLLASVLGLSAAQVLGRPERLLSAEEAESFGRCIARRVAREPVSRILGERDFYGRSFAISPATLDPRPDSETLIEAALEFAAAEGWLARAAAASWMSARARAACCSRCWPSCRTRSASART